MVRNDGDKFDEFITKKKKRLLGMSLTLSQCLLVSHGQRSQLFLASSAGPTCD